MARAERRAERARVVAKWLARGVKSAAKRASHAGCSCGMCRRERWEQHKASKAARGPERRAALVEVF